MNQQSETTPDAVDDCGCKIGRIADRYELESLSRNLVSRWQGKSDERFSLRQLETYANERILKSVMNQTTMTILDGDESHLYERLTGESVSAGQRVETENYLKRAGINVERVRNDFVSHQTVHSHLRECLGAVRKKPQRGGQSRVENASKTVFALKNRMRAVTEEAVGRLARTDLIAVDSFDVYIDATVVCGDCNRSVPFSKLLENGGCRCQLGDNETAQATEVAKRSSVSDIERVE